MRKEIQELFKKWESGAGICIDTRLTTQEERDWLDKQIEDSVKASKRRTS